MCICEQQMFGSSHNPFIPSELCYLNPLDGSFSNRMGVVFLLLLPCFIDIPVVNANSVDWGYTVCQSPIYGTLGIFVAFYTKSVTTF